MNKEKKNNLITNKFPIKIKNTYYLDTNVKTL